MAHFIARVVICFIFVLEACNTFRLDCLAPFLQLLAARKAVTRRVNVMLSEVDEGASVLR